MSACSPRGSTTSTRPPSRCSSATTGPRPIRDGYPTGAEIVTRYLEPLAAVPEIAGSLHLGARVTGVTKAGIDKLKDAGRDEAPFELVVDERGTEQRYWRVR